MTHNHSITSHMPKFSIKDAFPWTSRFYTIFLHACLIAMLIIFLNTNTAQADVTCEPPGINNITPYLGTWHGHIGLSAITVFMKPHVQDPYRVQGYYIYSAEPHKQILIVGEPVHGRFDMEESIDGSDISGVWDIAFPVKAPTVNDCYRFLQGEWLDGHFENPQSVTLQREISW